MVAFACAGFFRLGIMLWLAFSEYQRASASGVRRKELDSRLRCYALGRPTV
jgi:hypothetical protein